MNKTRRKLKPIARKRRNILYLLLTILFAISTGYIFFNFSPEYKIQILSFGIPIIPFFLISFFILAYSALRFVFIKQNQAVLISVLFFAYLIVRLLGLTHWIFAALFIALFITLEFFLAKQK